jgi:hypothetical protein
MYNIIIYNIVPLCQFLSFSVSFIIPLCHYRLCATFGQICPQTIPKHHPLRTVRQIWSTKLLRKTSNISHTHTYTHTPEDYFTVQTLQLLQPQMPCICKPAPPSCSSNWVVGASGALRNTKNIWNKVIRLSVVLRLCHPCTPHLCHPLL